MALPPDLWKIYEPRFGFPLFADMKTAVGLAFDLGYRPRGLRRMLSLAKGVVRYRNPPLGSFLAEQAGLWLTPRPRAAFRLAVLSRDGDYLGSVAIPGSYGAGSSMVYDCDEALRTLGLEPADRMAMLVLSRGNADGWRTSPGSFTMSYSGERSFCAYRTGAFARTLNDPGRKSHVGFRGINPKAEATAEAVASVLLINHSSDPRWDAVADPRCELLRADGEKLTAGFGAIPPFGARERSLPDLFGPGVEDFLAPGGGLGTLITTCEGVTLASLHLLRNRAGQLKAIEHSRPTHAYLAGQAA